MSNAKALQREAPRLEALYAETMLIPPVGTAQEMALAGLPVIAETS